MFSVKWSLLLGIGVSAGCVWFIISRMDFILLVSTLKSIRYVILVPVLCVLASGFLLRAWRWRYLLEPVKPITTLNLLSITCIGDMANMIFPARAGEFIRAYRLGEKENVSKLTSFATIVVEKALDLVSILIVLVLLLTFVNFPSKVNASLDDIKFGSYIPALFMILIACAVFMVKCTSIHKLLNFRPMTTFIPTAIMDNFVTIQKEYFSYCGRTKINLNYIKIILLSFFIMMIHTLSNFLIIYAFHLSLPFYAAFLILVVQTFGLIIPSSPGSIGTYHAAVIVGFSFFDVSQEVALGIAIIMHAATFFTSAVLGFLSLVREHIPLLGLRSLLSGR